METVDDGQVTVGSYEYDENGNMTCRVEDGITYKQEYNTENRISSIMKLAEGTCEDVVKIATKWDFAYDGDGTRTATLTTTYDENGSPTGTSWTAYFFGGAYEVRSDSTTIKYYSFGGQTIMNDGSGLKYLLTDHLGSVVAVTDENGNLVSQQRYLPFGAVRSDINDITQTDYGYTGQRNLDNDIGLMDYRARFYSPLLNRFIQPDSIVPHPFNSQSYNRYSYVYNNPIVYTDPSGHAICLDGIYCGTPTNSSYQNYVYPVSSNGNSGGAGGNGGGGGNGGNEGDSPQGDVCHGALCSLTENSSEQNNECTNWWEYCVTDIPSDVMDSYWDQNNEYISASGNVGNFIWGLGALELTLQALVFFGLVALDPEPVTKFTLFVVGAVVVSEVALSIASSDLQMVNNAIVKTGALNSGGSISATPWSITVHSSTGNSQPVDTISPIPLVSLWLFANSRDNP